MLIVRIKQAEHALADGRLEEACELLRYAEIRAYRRGQQLVTQLVQKLVERSRVHLAAGRLPQAQSDADRALAFGGNLPDVAQLRAAIANAVETGMRDDRRRGQLLAAARQQIDRGQLKLGEKWLADVSVVESRAAVLMRDLDVKKSTLENAINAASAALDRNDLASAVRELIRAREADASDARVIELCASASDQIKAKLVEAIDAGRLDLAQTLAQQWASVCGDTADVQEYRRGIEQCRTAWSHLDSGDPGRAAEILKRVSMIFPSALWIGTALSHMKAADSALAELRGGPLALLSSTSAFSLPMARQEGVKPAMHGLEARVTGSLPSRFILRVDGAGSFCVFRQPIVTVGPISSSHQPDLGLLAEPGIPIATIERREDEYFIRGSAVAVNDRAGNGKLLACGDRIALSPRCRMSFNLPSAASMTAVLDLTGCRYPRADVRRVILLDGDVILGPGMATHVRVEGAVENVILHVRDGRLFCEARQPVEVNGEPMDRISGIAMDAHVKVGSVSFVVSGA